MRSGWPCSPHHVHYFTHLPQPIESPHMSDDEVVRIIRHVQVPRTVTHHALVIHRLLKKSVDEEKLACAATVVALACLLYTMKERNRTNLAHSLAALRKECAESQVVALEMWMVETIQEKVIIAEACLRLSLKQFLMENEHLHRTGEDIVTLALALMPPLYDSDNCLLPESSACAAILAACNLAGLQHVKTPPGWSGATIHGIRDALIAAAQ